MKEYPQRLFHKTPSWIQDGSVFHIRIRCSAENQKVLTEPGAGEALLESAEFYMQKGRWFIHLFLLMPDHIHALISFPKDEIMSRVIADWKRYQAGMMGICWQGNFFDHRIRNTAEYFEKSAYIRNNPVVKGLCETPEGWRWILEGGTRPPASASTFAEASADRPGGNGCNATSGRVSCRRVAVRVQARTECLLHLRNKHARRSRSTFCAFLRPLLL